MQREAVGNARQARGQHRDGAAGLGDVIVYVSDAFILHPLREHQGLCEIDEIVGSPAKAFRRRAPSRCETLNEGRGATNGLKQCGSERGRARSGREDVERAALFGFLLRTNDVLATGAADAGRQNIEADRAQRRDLALNERVRRARIFSGEVGKLALQTCRHHASSMP